jgi:hypothetical protein
MSIDENGFLDSDIIKFCGLITNQHRIYFDYCYSLNRLANLSKYKIKVMNTNGQQVIAACLFTRILEGYQATIILLRYGLQVDAQVTLRSVLEAFYKLKGICEKSDFMGKYIKDGELDQFRTLETIQKSDNPYFAPFKQSNTDNSLREIQNKISELKGAKITVKEIAKCVGLLNWHESTYKHLCDAVHTSPKLLEKYLNIDDKDNLRGLFWGPNIEGNFELIILTAAEILFYTLRSAQALFLLRIKTQLKEHYSKLNKLFKLMDKAHKELT